MKEKDRGRLKKFKVALSESVTAIGVPKIIVFAFLACSLLLSLSIILRFFFTVDLILRVFDIVMYWSLFFFIPLAAIFWILNEVTKRKMRKATAFSAVILVVYLVYWSIAFIAPFIPEYLILWFPVPLIVALESKWVGRLGRNKKYLAFLTSGLAISVLLPNMSVLIGINGLSNAAESLNGDSAKASFISGRVIALTAFGWIPRAGPDSWKFLMLGAGACGEMAMAGTDLMKEATLEVRKVALPGEDHAFIEVMVDGEFLIADSGYYGTELITRSERADRRVKEIGSLTYAVALTENSFIELTQQYVSTDTIVIRITRNGEPLSDVSVTLKHKFGSLTTQLPVDGNAFHTDVNGTISLHMGKPHYINGFKGSEEFYWIYADGQNTGYNVTSTGTGLVHSVEIDLLHLNS